MINTIVIEDEIEIQNFIVALLRTYCKDLRIVGTAPSVVQGRSLIRDKRPELVFLDVELEDGTAFEILESFDVNEFVTIFLTGYSKYGIEGVKYSVGDYLLKPIILKDLIKSVEKAKQKVLEKKILRKFHGLGQFDEIHEKIMIQRVSGEKIVLSYSEIIRWQTEQGYTRVYLVDGQHFLLNGTLKSFCEQLPSYFVRIHRSHIINVRFVWSYEIKRNGCVKLNNGMALPISTRQKRKFQDAVHTFLQMNNPLALNSDTKQFE